MSAEPTDARITEIVRQMRTVAVVGMKGEAARGQPAFDIPRMLQGRGIQVTPVNPTLKEALGVPSLPSVAALPGPVDVLNVFRRVDAIPQLADEVLALPPGRRPAVVWLQTGIRHDESAARLRAVGMTVIMDACLGVWATRVRPR
ncbi:MAG TPA: CoA-binding protein [Myxococcota bacterium]|nr:CoA-binding protein [Myxococcota bacterium]